MIFQYMGDLIMKERVRRGFDQCIRVFVYAGIDKQEYLQIKDGIREANLKSLCTSSLCMVIMFAVLFVMSFIFPMMSLNRMAYGTVGVVFLAIWICCRWFEQKIRPIVIFVWYVALSTMCAYATVLNTVIRNDVSATTFCVFILAAPLLFTDRPWRLFLYVAFVTVIFISLSFHNKEYSLAFLDTLNSLCCGFIGCVVNHRILQARQANLLQKLEIEKERDMDKLTACLTKAAFERKITEKLQSDKEEGVLMVVDVDHFKNVNDNYGHEFGDQVLGIIGRCFVDCFPEGAMFGRFGSDEFQVWLPRRILQNDLTAYLDQLLHTANAIETPDGKQMISFSIGVVLVPQNGTCYNDLFSNADEALYMAKKTGRNRFVFFDGMEETV